MLQGPGEQGLGIRQRIPAQRVLACQQEGPRGTRPVARRRGVPGHRLRRPRQEVGRLPVVGGPHRLRRRRVDHLLDEVVGELVAAACHPQQAGPGRALAALHRHPGRDAQHPGDDGGIDGRAEHRARAQQLLRLLARPPQPGQHGRLERLGHPGLARPQGAERLDDEQRVPTRAAQDRRGQLGVAVRGRELRHRGRVERADVEPPADVGERGERGAALLRADRRDDQDAVAGAAAGEVVQQLDGGETRVLQIVEHEQHGAPRREPVQHAGDALERPAQLDLRAAPLGRRRPQHGRELRQEPGEIRGVRTGDPDQLRGRPGRQHGSERVHERLQEQGALGRVAPRREHQRARGPRVVGDGVGEPGLADPGLAGHQHDLEAPRDGRGPAPGEDGDLGGASGECGWRLRGRPVAQEGQVQVAGGCGGLDAELVGQRRAERCVDGQRLALLPRGGQRPHEQPMGLLVETVRGDGGLRGGDGRAYVARAERRRPESEPGRPQQPLAFGAGRDQPRRVGLVDQHGARPEQIQGTPGGRGAAIEPLPSVGEQLSGLMEIDADRGAERVAPPPTLDHVGAERRPQSADERGDVLRRPPRRTFRPERRDDRVDRHDPPVRNRQHRQEPPGLAAAKTGLDRGRSVTPDAEDTDEPDGEAGHAPRLASNREEAAKPRRSQPTHRAPAGVCGHLGRPLSRPAGR